MNADEYNEAGRDALDSGELERAAGLFRQATKLAPDWSTPHYNLGLVYKFEKRWPESLEANLRGHELAPDDDACFWNLAIASAALGRWDKARIAFAAIGLKVPETPGPWDFRLGLVPIRLNPQGSAEVVWCRRLDPVRSRTNNIPLPDSGFCYGDVLLNDGEPVGYRKLHDREVPVFNQLELLEESAYHTFEAEIVCGDQALADLEAKLGEHEVYLEDWTSSIRMLCRACSEGRPHDHHDRELSAAPQGVRRVGVAARSEAALKELLGGHVRLEIISYTRFARADRSGRR